MFGKNLYRNAGWCALAAAILLVASSITFILSGEALTGVMVGVILLDIGLLLMAFVFYALYIVHRPESKVLGLAGLILWVISIGVSMASGTNSGNIPLNSLWNLLISLSFLIFGFLAWRSTRMPRGIAVVAILAGAIALIAGIGGLLGNLTILGNLSAFSQLFMLVWTIWLWRVLLSKKFAASASPVPAAA
jgi:hypothetical protein